MAETLTRAELKQKIKKWIPKQADAEEVVSGVAIALTPPKDRTRVLERGIGERGVRYAWSTKDVPVVESGLKLFGELLTGGTFSPKLLGMSVVELVTFLIRLRQNRARLTDPGLIAVLLILRDGPKSGMSATAIAKALAVQPKPPLSGRTEVEQALDTLATPKKGERPHPLVERDGNLWMTRV